MTIANLPERPYWQDSAACNGLNDDTFFPLSETEEYARVIGEKYCDRCPVRAECLSDGVLTRSRGVWAGTTSDLRAKLRKSRSRVKCVSCGQRQIVRVDGSQICLGCAISWPSPKE